MKKFNSLLVWARNFLEEVVLWTVVLLMVIYLIISVISNKIYAGGLAI